MLVDTLEGVVGQSDSISSSVSAGETLSEGFMEAPLPPVPDDAVSFIEEHENEAEILRTGSWHSLGADVQAGAVLGPEALPKGVRFRRMGTDVQIEALTSGVEITVDGSPSKGGTVSLLDQVVEVDGVRID
ncbi:MAG: hypothetical protein CL928_13095, partial [Deltaproteobacteria bacterium]|nr:hypothetical protein [Deltaproteobacteria bacterium]